MRPFAAVLAVLWLLAPLASTGETLVGEVVSIADGDSFTIRVQDERVKVRLIGIDAPELRQPWSRRAKQALERKLAGCALEIATEYDDRYGRRVGHARCGGRDVNRELVREGHAWVYRKGLRDESLLDDEARARADRAGLWSLPEQQRIPPWEWRRRAESARR